MLRVRALGQDTHLPGDPFNTPDLPSEGPSWSSGQYSSPIGPNQQAPAADPITIDTSSSSSSYRPQQVTNNYYGQQPQQQSNQYANPNQAYAAAAASAFMQARYPGQFNQQYPSGRLAVIGLVGLLFYSLLTTKQQPIVVTAAAPQGA